MAAASAKSLAQQPAWVAHWMSAARTASRRGDLRALRQALLRVPEHRELFDEGTGTPCRLLTRRLSAFWCTNRFCKRARPTWRTPAPSRLSRLSGPGPLLCFRFGRLPGGLLAGLLSRDRVGLRCRRTLRAWTSCRLTVGDAFVTRGGASADELERIRNCAVRGDVGAEPISYEDCQVMLRRPASAPAPDGLRYGHWARAGADMSRILYRAYLAVLDGREVSSGFNDGLVVFIQKSPVQPRVAATGLAVATSATDFVQHLP